MKPIAQSHNLQQTHYELRGKISAMAADLERHNHSILKLHLGNPGLFGLSTPPELLEAIQKNLSRSQGYCDSKGLLSSREAICEHLINQGAHNVHTERTYIGNGVSELINIALGALLNPGDEVLLPQPVYPLWSAVTTLNGGVIRYYSCEEKNDWLPNINHIEQQINSKTKAIVIINPNNPTGSVYPEHNIRAISQLAEKNQLILFSDEIYADIIYPPHTFKSVASITKDTLAITFGGLSKNYLLAGFRCAWMTASGTTKHANDYLNGIEKLLAMRLCANVPVQHAIPVALSNEHFDCLKQYPNMLRKRNRVIDALNSIEGISCLTPAGAFYAYPRFTLNQLPWENDHQWILEFLTHHHILLAPGSTFAQPDHRHFRLVLLPSEEQLLYACDELKKFIGTHVLCAQAI
jgi:alanine-synthesizing transaminase